MSAFVGCAMINNLTNSSEKKPLQVGIETREASDYMNIQHLKN